MQHDFYIYIFLPLFEQLKLSLQDEPKQIVQTKLKWLHITFTEYIRSLLFYKVDLQGEKRID